MRQYLWRNFLFPICETLTFSTFCEFLTATYLWFLIANLCIITNDHKQIVCTPSSCRLTPLIAVLSRFDASSLEYRSQQLTDEYLDYIFKRQQDLKVTILLVALLCPATVYHSVTPVSVLGVSLEYQPGIKELEVTDFMCNVRLSTLFLNNVRHFSLPESQLLLFLNHSKLLKKNK